MAATLGYGRVSAEIAYGQAQPTVKEDCGEAALARNASCDVALAGGRAACGALARTVRSKRSVGASTSTTSEPDNALTEPRGVNSSDRPGPAPGPATPTAPVGAGALDWATWP